MNIGTVIGTFVLTHLAASVFLLTILLTIYWCLPRISPAQRYAVTLTGFVAAALVPFSIFFTSTPISVSTPDVLISLQLPTLAALAVGALVWGAGLAWNSFRLFVSLVRMGALVSDAQPLTDRHDRPWLVRALDLRTSDQINSPLVAGLIDPIVLVPRTMEAKLNDPVTRGLIEHECAHIERRDLWVSLIQRLALAVYWWSPAMSWMSSRLDDEREMACDDVAARRLGDPHSYASSILDVADQVADQMAGRGTEGFSAAAVASPKGLVDRMRRLIDQPKSSNHPVLGLGLILLILMLTAFIAAATPRIPNHVPTPAIQSGELIASPVLIEAIGSQSTIIVQDLLAQGADHNTLLADGRTPLSEAIASGRSDLIELLLSVGADPNTVMPNNSPALHWAVRSGLEPNVFMLINAGADVNAPDPDGTTPLDLAFQAQNEHVIRYLLEAGANPN